MGGHRLLRARWGTLCAGGVAMRASPVCRLRGALTAFGGGPEQPGARILLSPRPAARPSHRHIALARGSAQQGGGVAPKLPLAPAAAAAALARASRTRQVVTAGAGVGGGGGISTVAVTPWCTRGVPPGRVSPARFGQGQKEEKAAQGPQAGRRLQLMRMRQPPWPHCSTVPGSGPGPLRQSACALLKPSIRHSSPRRSDLVNCSSCSSFSTVDCSSRSHHSPLPTSTRSQPLLFTDAITRSPTAPHSTRAISNPSLTTAASRFNSVLPASFALGQPMTEEGQSRGPESFPGTGTGAREARDTGLPEGYTGSVSVAALSLGPETGGSSGASSGRTQSTPPVAASGTPLVGASVSASPSHSSAPPVSASASSSETPPGTSSSTPASAASGNGAAGAPPEDPIVQHVVMRRDLVDKEKEGLGWPLGSVIAQGCHASVAAIWEFRGEPLAQRYMADLDNMRKVVLEVKNEAQLRELSKKLTAGGIPHKLWIEQPENIATCLATQPNLKSVAAPYFKKLRLCK